MRNSVLYCKIVLCRVSVTPIRRKVHAHRASRLPVCATVWCVGPWMGEVETEVDPPPTAPASSSTTSSATVLASVLCCRRCIDSRQLIY